MSSRAFQDTRPELNRDQMKEFLKAVARVIAVGEHLHSPKQVNGDHVDKAYNFLWATDELKFATEIHLDAGTVEKYLWDAAEKNR